MQPNGSTLFLLIICFGTGFCKIICNNRDNCLCLPGPDYEFQCPRNYAEVGGVVIHITEEKEILIDCSPDMDNFNIYELPNITINRIDRFRMRFCPLPQRSFKQIFDWFSLSKVEFLQFGSSNTQNRTLTKEYFEGLDMLQSLVLNRDRLIDVDEDVFSNTPNLISIELQENNIRLKPNLFKNTPLLKSLDISENELEDIPNGLFQDSENLELLHLWNNKLKILNELTFSGLSNLKSLELSGNRIENISENAFQNLTNLSRINLSKNNINAIPSNLFRTNTLLELVIMRNNFNLGLPDRLFSNLPLLQEIDLSKCNLKSLPEHIFENSVNIKTIKLEQNNLRVLSQSIFKGLVNLKKIQLNNNMIENIPDNIFGSLNQLGRLFLQNNLITEIGENTLSGLINLEEINLAENQISQIHYRAFYHKDNLKKIDISKNKYSGDHSNSLINSVLLENCPNVEHVDLSYNLITRVEDVITLMNKVHLEYLDVSHNYITSVNIKDLQALANKLIVNLNYNNITFVNFEYVDMIASSGNKKDIYSSSNQPYSLIYLANNPIECDCFNYDLVRYFRNEMSPEVKVMFEIRTENLTCASPLILRDFSVELLPPSLMKCPLDRLIANYTGCPEECSCNWRPFDKSIIVDCSNKDLTETPEIFLPPADVIQFNQTEVHLERNNLTAGPYRNQTGYSNVTKLFLSYNAIETIMWLPPKLEVLNLDNNQMGSLRYEVLRTLNNTPKLVNLTLQYNPWICECEAENFTNFLRQHTKQVDVRDIYCLNTGDLLIDLNRNDLCHEWQVVYLILMVMSIMLVSAILVALYYRYQQELKIWLFAKNWCLWWVTEEELDKDKIYDAFISYSHKDEDFVTQNLLPVLEGGPQPYKLCLHYRNWIPGEFITKQVTSSVFESRRTLVVLSPNFLESIWGKMEFRTAHTQAMSEGRARVIVVLYGDVDVNSLDNELKTYLKTNTYVKWGDPYFWNKLKYALPHSNKSMLNNNQKHANVMNCIDDKFNLVAPVTPNPGSTPPVLTLDPGLLKKHPLNFVPSSHEMDTPPAEAGSLLTSTCL